MFSQIGFCKHLYERFCIKSIITQIEELLRIIFLYPLIFALFIVLVLIIIIKIQNILFFSSSRIDPVYLSQKLNAYF